MAPIPTTPEAPAPAAVGTGPTVDPRPRAERLRGPLAVAGLAVASVGYVVLFDPNEGGPIPACPLKSTTGLDCPFCGGLRCARALVSGDVATAWDRNALALVMIPLAVVAWAVWLVRAWTGRRPAPSPRRARAATIAWTVALLVLLAWAVWRNLPAGAFFGSGLTS